MPDPASMLAAALTLAAEGYPVFFLGRRKRPVANCPTCPKAETDPSHDPEGCTCLTCHGFYAATRDHARIHAIHKAVPGGMLAIRTGHAADLAVIDIDPPQRRRRAPRPDATHPVRTHRLRRLAPVLPPPRRHPRRQTPR